MLLVCGPTFETLLVLLGIFLAVAFVPFYLFLLVYKTILKHHHVQENDTGKFFSRVGLYFLSIGTLVGILWVWNA